MKRVFWLVFFAMITLAIMFAGCARHEQKQSTKLQVITSLFPLYDFARTIAGDKGEVSLLLPPGMEPHSYEPKPDDIMRIRKAGLFIYTNRYMEPWAETLLKGIDRRKAQVVDAGHGVTYLKAGMDAGHDHVGHSAEEHGSGMDPHIWLDFGNDRIIVANILAGFLLADPANAAYYRANAAGLDAKLEALDQRYQRGLASCSTKVFLHGGHFAFGYMAHRYGLEYHSLSGVSSESEPSASRMTAMVRQIKQSGVRYLFAEELLSPRLTETLAEETGVGVLKIHGAHNLGRDDFKRGVTFIELMEKNLNNLQKGLGCRMK
ncbi:MAG: zinc ABC transporter substrate-binding protein [Pedobacter sp.]